MDININPPHDGCEWMIQSVHVEDFHLTEALVDQYFHGLYAFAYRLTGSPQGSAAATRRVIGNTVRLRHRISLEINLLCYLYRQVYLTCHEKFSLSGWLVRHFLPGKYSFHSYKKKHNQDSLETLFLALYYGHSLDMDEIAFIFDTSTQDIHNVLIIAIAREGGRFDRKNNLEGELNPDLSPSWTSSSLSGHFGNFTCPLQYPAGCLGCQESCSWLTGLERSLKEVYAFSKICDLKEERKAVLQAAGLNRQGLRRSGGWKEKALAASLLVCMVLFGISQEVFTLLDKNSAPTYPLVGTPTSTHSIAPSFSITDTSSGVVILHDQDGSVERVLSIPANTDQTGITQIFLAPHNSLTSDNEEWSQSRIIKVEELAR
jgi:hypothetical protein